MTNPIHSLNTTPITTTTSDNRSSQDRLASVFTSQSEGSHTPTSSRSYTPPGTPSLPIANPSSLGSRSFEGRLVSISSQSESTHASTSSCSYTPPDATATSSTPLNNQNLVEKALHRMMSPFRKQPKNSSHAPTSATNIVSTTPVLEKPPLSNELESTLQLWIKEAPRGEKDAREKFYNIVVDFHSRQFRATFKALQLGLTSLPDIFNDKIFEELKYCDLSANQLSELPLSFASLKKLENLGLSNNKLKQLPEGFGNLENLKKLNLKNNSLSELPEFSSKKLEQVIVSNNFLTKIPPSLCSLEKIQLDASYNPNGHLKSNYIPSYSLPKNYKKIRLPNTEPPHKIDDLTNKEDASCKNLLIDWVKGAHEEKSREKACNAIVSFLLKSDQVYLDLSGLGLTSLPKIFEDSRFSRLAFLDLSENKLESIPEEIIHLEQLQKIDVINNKLTTLPPKLLEKLIDQFSKVPSYLV